ncbi:MAG: GAF domain-containing protein [Actinomycetota bacterium]
MTPSSRIASNQDRSFDRDARAPSVGEDLSARRLRELEALYSISSVIHASLDFDQVLRHALEQVLDVFGFPAGVLRLLDSPTGELVPTAAVGLPQEMAEELSGAVRVGEGLGGLAAKERAIAVVEDLPQSAYADSAWARHGFRTYVAAPLQCKGMLLGCLNLATDGLRAFGEADRELLAALTNQIAMAVANTELYAGAQRKIEHLSALHQCSRDLGPTPELPQVLQVTTQRMAQLLRLERTAVLFYAPDSREVVGAAAHGFPDEALQTLRAPLDTLPAAKAVLLEGQSWMSAQPALDGLLPEEFVESAEIVSAFAVPLIADQEIIGLLVGDRRGEQLRLSADEMDLAMIFVNQASVWIARARALAVSTAAQAKFRDLLELAPDAIVLVDRDGRISLVNSQAERMFDYRREAMIGLPVETLIPERYRPGHGAHRASYHLEPRTRPMGSGLDLFARRRDGSEVPVEISLSPTSTDDGAFVITIIREVTERKRAEEERAQLLASEREKGEQLKLAIREAHHRIKNNLQAISDLLYLELASGGTATAEDILRESLERVQSIALVHDLLSQDEDVQTVDLRALAERLVPMVLRGGSRSMEKVVTQLNVPSIALSSKKGTTLALILNELVSNAVKHAFSGRQGGRLTVRLAQAEEGLALRVEDDGPGLPAGFELAKDASVGLQVVRTLAERDLAGKLRLSGGPGLTAEVWFPW